MSPRLSDLLLSSQSDERLVSLAQAGHERAFATIVERYRPELQAMARRLCSDGRSEDVVQQAFLSAFAALQSGCEVRHLRGWLYRIVRNTAGREDAPGFVPLDGTIPSGHVLEEVVQQRAMATAVLSEIARLPARQRQAMIGTALDGRGRAEIASSMGLSEGAVRQLVHRARATLRSAVTALTPWPLARWLAAAGPDAPGPGELAAGAGAASSGGLAFKLGALLASGTLLTAAAVHLQALPAHHGGVHAATPVHVPRAVAHAHPVAVASVAPPLLAGRGSPAAGAGPVGPARGATRGATQPVTQAGATQRVPRHGRHGEGQSTGSALRSEGFPVAGHDGSRGGRTDPGASSGSGRRDGGGASSLPVSSTRTGADGGHDGSGSRSGTDGHDGSSGSSASGTGSDAGISQMASASSPLDSGGSGSHDGSDPGGTSGGGSTSSFGSGSDGGSSSDGGTRLAGVSGSDGGSGLSDGGGTSGG